MPEISIHTQRLVERYKSWYRSLHSPKPEIGTIHVDEVASRVASFYEKIKGLIDWREEHLLKRAGIERALKRWLLVKKDGETIAEPLVLELIRGGHFPNDKIEESKINDVQKLIDKYIFILQNAPPPPGKKIKLRLYDWLSAIAACEIEEVLQPPLKENALMDYMYELMKKKIVVREEKIIERKMSEEEKNTQIYIAVRRALFKLDPPIISYHLLKKRYPDWSDLSENQLKEISQDIYSIWEDIEKDLNHHSSHKFYKICEKYDTPFLLLSDVISQNPFQAEANLQNSGVLEEQLRSAYDKRLRQIKGRLGRAAVFTTLSIFFTKILVALAIEIPFDKYVTHEFSYFTLGLSIAIPPLLMFFLVLSIKPPKKENLELAIMETMKIVYKKEKEDIYEIKPARKRGIFLNSIIILFYLLSFVITFGVIVWGLEKLNFSILSQIIFIGFISLIAFAGVKIRERAKELVVEEKKEGIIQSVVDFFSLPLIQLGKWLSRQWAKHNVLVVLFNALIDMPFQLFVEFLEQWRYFLKEKKEKIH